VARHPSQEELTMRVGVDLFTLRDLHLAPLKALDYVKAHGLAGAQGASAPDTEDPEAMARAKEFRAYGDSLGLYTEAGAHSPNPNVGGMPRDELRQRLTKQIANAAACGWHELHSWAGGPDARWSSPVRWRKHMDDTKAVFREIAPVLRDQGSRINLEPKGGLSTFEAVEIVEDVGPDVAGVCLDVANVLCFAEEPAAELAVGHPAGAALVHVQARTHLLPQLAELLRREGRLEEDLPQQLHRPLQVLGQAGGVD
jgi:sugar phosphate isomerase/epimerase